MRRGFCLITYKGDQVPEVKFAKESNQLMNSILVPHCSNNPEATWFCNLSKFLSILNSWSQVSLYFVKTNEINMKYLQLYHRVRIPQVDVLNADIRPMSSDEECPTFVDALLWTCHPRKLNVSSPCKMIACFMDRLMHMKNSSYSISHESKPWHSQLKEVKYTFDLKDQPVELTSRELKRITFWMRHKVYFLLDW